MARIACTLADVLEAARTKLVTAGIFTDSQAFLTLDADDMPPGNPAAPLAGLTFGSIDRRMDTMHVEEEPGDAVTVEKELTVSLWTQVAFDQTGQDGLALTHATLGFSTLISQVVNALNNGDLDDGTDTLTWRPVIFLGVRSRGRWKKSPNWRSMLIRFNVAFEWKVDS